MIKLKSRKFAVSFVWMIAKRVVKTIHKNYKSHQNPFPVINLNLN